MRSIAWGVTGLALLILSGVTWAGGEAEAVAALKKVGATILYEDNNPKKAVRSVYLSGKNLTDASLKHLAALKKLEFLALEGTPGITDERVKELASLEQLRDLGLGSTQVTDAGVKHLTRLKDLRRLNLNFTKVSDAGLKDLATLTRLETLGLQFTQVTPEGVKKLQQALPKCKIFH